jgi:hypothetical protein
MSQYLAARDVQPIDFFGGMMRGIDAAQKHRENNFRLDGLQSQSDWQKDNIEAQQVMRAMQLGATSPETWDSAMGDLAKEGNKTAERYVGQWRPLLAPKLLNSFKKAYGIGAQPGQQGGGQAAGAPVDERAAPFEAEQQKQLQQAIANMPEKQRSEKMRHYEHMLRAMDNVRNPADVAAMLEDFEGRKMISPEHAEQLRMRYAEPQSIWKNFQDDFNKVQNIRDAVATYSMPNQMGIPVGPQPSYKSQWDAENRFGVVMKETPGQAPEFSVQTPAGIPAGPAAGGKWPEGLKDTVSQEAQFRQQWQSNPQVQAALGLKNATEMLMKLDPNTNTGVSDVAAVYQFVKALDPTSVVREGEIALLGEAKSLIDRIRGSAERVQKGRTLTPSLLRDMQAAAKGLRDIAYDSYKHQRRKNMESIKPFAGYIDAERAFPDYWGAKGFVEPPPPPVTGTGKGTGIGGVPSPGNDIEDVPGDY